MTTPADAVIAAARKHLGNSGAVFYSDPKNACAAFVSRVFQDAGVVPVIAGRKWSSSDSVPAVVAEFPSSQRDPSELDGNLADLVVFGANSHLMIYTGSGHVIGTLSTPKTGPSSSVVTEVFIGDVQPAFSLILHTGLATGDQQTSLKTTSGSGLDPVAAAEAVAAATANAITTGFGTIFAWVPGFAVNAGILVFAAALVWAGIRELVASAD